VWANSPITATLWGISEHVVLEEIPRGNDAAAGVLGARPWV
jgi:hypothetical protein